MRVFAEIAREQRLLNVAGAIDFLLESLAFALSFNEAGVVKDARGVGGESIENLTVEFGEGGGTARIEVEDAEEIPALYVDHGFLRVGAGHPKKRNHHHGSEALGHDALRGLQIHVGLRKVFGNDWRLLFHLELDGRLARREALGREAQSAAPPREFDVERARDV